MSQVAHQHLHIEHLTAICMYCKSVRSSQGTWHKSESLDYQVDVDHLTHSACPTCYGVAVIAMLEEIREEFGIVK